MANWSVLWSLSHRSTLISTHAAISHSPHGPVSQLPTWKLWMWYTNWPVLLCKSATKTNVKHLCIYFKMPFYSDFDMFLWLLLIWQEYVHSHNNHDSPQLIFHKFKIIICLLRKNHYDTTRPGVSADRNYNFIKLLIAIKNRNWLNITSKCK